MIALLHLDGNGKDLLMRELDELCPRYDMATWNGANKHAAKLAASKVVFAILNSVGSPTPRNNLSVHTLMPGGGG
jgi:hypothetical protein